MTIDDEIYHFGADGAQQGEPTTADDSSNQDLVFYMNTASDSSNADNLAASAAGASTPAAEADISSDRGEDSRKASSEARIDTSEASSAASEVSPVPEASVTSEPTVSPEPKGMIALTFDDGPSDFTDRLLDCLEANNVKATFFLAGQEVEIFSG